MLILMPLGTPITVPVKALATGVLAFPLNTVLPCFHRLACLAYNTLFPPHRRIDVPDIPNILVFPHGCNGVRGIQALRHEFSKSWRSRSGCGRGLWQWPLGPFMGLRPASAGYSPAILWRGG